jgi:hypothetical protein
MLQGWLYRSEYMQFAETTVTSAKSKNKTKPNKKVFIYYTNA